MKIVLNQTLHGYANGHRLLSKSQELSTVSQRIMSIMSDLSGSDIKDGFYSYFTGYVLKEENVYVLSKTWYADEMSRPGCVWSHSLLIPADIISFLGKDINKVISLFKRPDNNNWNEYSSKIEISISDRMNTPIMKDANIEYLIWSIWGNTLPVIIPSNNSDFFSEELFFLWLNQNNNLKPDFCFSTGSFSNREIESDIMDLQIVPTSCIHRFANANKDPSILNDQKTIKSYPLWVTKAREELMKDQWMSFNSFRTTFGAQLSIYKYFVSFMKLYIGSGASKNSTNLSEILSLTSNLFTIAEQAIILKNVTDLYVSDNKKVIAGMQISTSILSFLIDNPNVEIDVASIQYLVNHSLLENIEEVKKILLRIVQKENSRADYILNCYVNTITFDRFEDIVGLGIDVCLAFVTTSPKFVYAETLWTMPIEFQSKIMNCLCSVYQKQDIDVKFIEIVLLHSSFDFSKNLYNFFGSMCVPVFLDFFLSEKISKNNYIDFSSYCRNHGSICVDYLSKHLKKLMPQQLLGLISMIDSYNSSIMKLTKTQLEQIYKRIQTINHLTTQAKAQLAYFLIPIILKAKFLLPNDMVTFSVELVHSDILSNTFPDLEWRKLSNLLPDSFFNSWDKCKRLRKAFYKKGYNLRVLSNYNDIDDDIPQEK